MQLQPGNDVLEICTRMQDAKSSKQVRDLATEAISLLGWESWVYVGHVAVRMAQTSTALLASNYSLLWLAEYRFKGYYDVDPIVEHLMMNDLPLVWQSDEDLWKKSDAGVQNFMSRIRSRGYTGGVGTPVHTLVSRGFLNVTTSRPFTEMDVPIQNIKVFGLLIGNSMHDALYRLSFPERVRLSEMQRKVLQWVAEGASADVIADKLGIKVPTVLYHIAQAQKKLRVENISTKNRQELITKAYAMGYLNAVMKWGDDTVLNAPDLESKLVDAWEKEVRPDINGK